VRRDSPDPDPNATFEVRVSPWPYLVVVVGAAPFFAVLVLGMLYHIPQHGFEMDPATAVLLLTMAMSGGLILLSIRQLIPWRKTVITLSPEGYRDLRKLGEPIPWPEITAISSWGGRFASLRLSLSAPWTERLLGEPGLRRKLRALDSFSRTPIFVSAAGNLSLSPTELERIAKLYAAAHGGPRPD
jgi:hypothetical protein